VRSAQRANDPPPRAQAALPPRSQMAAITSAASGALTVAASTFSPGQQAPALKVDTAERGTLLVAAADPFLLSDLALWRTADATWNRMSCLAACLLLRLQRYSRGAGFVRFTWRWPRRQW
jgi:hypothetical protein